MRLENKTVVITGATGSIGKATAKLFFEHGANLCLVGRDEGKLQALECEFGESENMIFSCAEAKDEQAIKRSITSAKDAFGAIHAVIANGGTEGVIQPLTDYSVGDFNEIIHVNVTGVWLLMKHAVPVMKEQGSGSFVALSSVAGQAGFPGICPYAASKHAVNGMIKTACLEFATDNLRFNSLAPGPIDNRMMQSLHEQLNSDDPASIKDSVTESIPMGRYGTNEEIAKFALFLASDESSYCNGGIYVADGGKTAG